MQDQLPSLAELDHVLEQYYNRQAMADGEVNHSILLYMGWKLIRHGRNRDLLEILGLISGSPFGRKPHGREFDIDVLELWLKTAKQLRSAPHCRSALEAAVDGRTKLRLTRNFMLLVDTTIQTVVHHRFKKLKWEERQAFRELDWLARTLHQTLDARTSKAHSKVYRKLKRSHSDFAEISFGPDRTFASKG